MSLGQAVWRTPSPLALLSSNYACLGRAVLASCTEVSSFAISSSHRTHIQQNSVRIEALSGEVVSISNEVHIFNTQIVALTRVHHFLVVVDLRTRNDSTQQSEAATLKTPLVPACRF